MFREVRKTNRALDQATSLEVLKNNHTAVIAMVDPEGNPYAVPMNYSVIDGSIIIHCGIEGHKIDCLKHCSRVCMSIIDYEEMSSEDVTAFYRSVTVHGEAGWVTDPEEKYQLISKLTDNLAGVPYKKCMDAVRAGNFPMEIIRIKPLHVTGKEKSKVAYRAGL